ncbi:methyltransferase-like protein 27 [Xenia sp. Carnegie-2017]|uniref:methyltransferase-like protein 27 n=1 Tax=Xenia sp. Carnegie-2017 TaxID=2897299 RepID=UPI001F03EFE9|nr:methyltransferase-like protein 27 [Xenia sp. Carnegie-2017]
MTEDKNKGYFAVDKLMKKAKTADVTLDDINDAYATHSAIYETGMKNNDYSGHIVAVSKLTQKLKEFEFTNNVRIIDMGCGTGMAGEQLSKHGYTNLDGVDLNFQMLELARKKGIYKSLQTGAMGSPNCKDLGINPNEYDAAICTGVLALAHVESEGLNDLIHVVKPGGLVCFSIRDMHYNTKKCNFPESIEQNCKDGKWKLIDKHHQENYLEGDGAWYFVCQIL